MKKNEIEVGVDYTDGKSIRRVLAAGPQFKLYDSQADEDCIQYAIVKGKRGTCDHGRTPDGLQIMHTTRTSFAAWAKQRQAAQTGGK